MKHKKSLDISGTCLQGEINVSYGDLEMELGTPRLYKHTDKENEGGKVDAEWCLETYFGVGTIYNYKDGINYLGKDEGTPTHKITQWHIGGKNKETYAYILGYLHLK